MKDFVTLASIWKSYSQRYVPIVAPFQTRCTIVSLAVKIASFQQRGTQDTDEHTEDDEDNNEDDVSDREK